MAKKHRMRHYRRRRAISRGPRKWTILKGIKYLIAFAPAFAHAKAGYDGYSGGGSSPLLGLKGAAAYFTEAYSGYNFIDGSWQWQRLKVGYAPLAGAWIFGKIASRVLR